MPDWRWHQRRFQCSFRFTACTNSYSVERCFAIPNMENVSGPRSPWIYPLGCGPGSTSADEMRSEPWHAETDFIHIIRSFTGNDDAWHLFLPDFVICHVSVQLPLSRQGCLGGFITNLLFFSLFVPLFPWNAEIFGISRNTNKHFWENNSFPQNSCIHPLMRHKTEASNTFASPGSFKTAELSNSCVFVSIAHLTRFLRNKIL